MYIEKLKKMFSEMVLLKNVNLIPVYYHPDMLLYTNEQITDYNEFFESHKIYYASSIQYQVEYDENTFFENENKVAGRMWITVTRPNEMPKKLEVILICEFKDDKIYRVWELTYPDWSKMPAFASQSEKVS